MSMARRRVAISAGPGPMRPCGGRRRWRRPALIVLLVLLAIPGVSYGRALTYPGHASLSVRTVEWVRDNGGGSLVDAVENWIYARNTPSTAGTPTATVFGQQGMDSGRAYPQGPGGPAFRRYPHATVPPKPAPPPVRLPTVRRLTRLPALAGEGHWTAMRTVASKHPGGSKDPHLYVTWVRPDPAHAPVIAAAALIPQRFDRVRLVAGTRDPVPGMSSPEGSQVPSAALPKLVAAFNGGWRSFQANGGWYDHRRVAVKLVHGAASVVVDANGRARIGSWGVDVGMGRQVVAVRQNLVLIIRAGRPVPGLSTNFDGRFGTQHFQLQYTWRSGIGTDRYGDLVYVGGDSLTLSTLAEAMTQVGIVDGMMLDMHPHMVTFNIEQHHGHRLVPQKLLTSMTESAARYLTADQRDFFYVTAR